MTQPYLSGCCCSTQPPTRCGTCPHFVAVCRGPYRLRRVSDGQVFAFPYCRPMWIDNVVSSTSPAVWTHGLCGGFDPCCRASPPLTPASFITDHLAMFCFAPGRWRIGITVRTGTPPVDIATLIYQMSANTCLGATWELLSATFATGWEAVAYPGVRTCDTDDCCGIVPPPPPPPPPPCPAGACCLPTGICDEVCEDVCLNNGGIWLGANTSCLNLPPCPDAGAFRRLAEGNRGWDRSQPSRGLGDTVAKMIPGVLSDWAHRRGCRCNVRQERLNALVKYRKTTTGR